MIYKHTYETIKNFIDTKTHFELLQDYFVDRFTPLKLKCKDCDNEIVMINFNDLQRKVDKSKIINCDKCNKKERQLKTIKEYLEKYGQGCVLIEKSYDNLFNEYLEFKCPTCGEHFFNTYYVLKMRKYKTCKKCSDEVIANKTRERARIYNENKPKKEKKKLKRGYTYEQVLDFVNSTNCKLVSTEYTTAQTPMDFVCDEDDCNETFTTTFNVFKNSGRRKCDKHSNEAIGRKNAHSFDYVKEYIENLGSQLYSTEYKNNLTKIKVKCTECAEEYETNYASIKKNNKVICPKCSFKLSGESQLIPYSEVKNIIEKEGCILLSKEYKGATKKLNILCSCGEHKFKTTFSGFKDGKIKCDYCMNQIQWNYELISEYVKNNSSSILLSTKYKNTHSKLKFKCECGSEYSTSWHEFYDEKKKKRQCNECGWREQHDQQRLSYEYVYNEIAESGCELISTEYINLNDKLKIKCALCGKEFTSTLSAFRKRNVKACQSCNKSMSAGERKFKELLELNNITFITQHTYDDCKYKGKLRFDFLLTDYNYLIEIDGLFHFKSISYFGGKKKFKVTKIRDGIKNTYCKMNNIPLIRIPYDDRNMTNFIKRSEIVIGHILSGKFEQILKNKLKIKRSLKTTLYF